MAPFKAAEKNAAEKRRIPTRVKAETKSGSAEKTERASTKKVTKKEDSKSKAASTKSENEANTSRPRKREPGETEERPSKKVRKVEPESKSKTLRAMENAQFARKTDARRTRPATTAEPEGHLVFPNERPSQTLAVFVFGSNQQGELGLGEGTSVQDVKRPRFNPQLDPATAGIVQLATGGMHTAAVTRENKILTWGVNDLGALGRDTDWSGGMKDIDADESSDDEGSLNPKEATPTAVEFVGINPLPIFVQVAAGDSATFALTQQGEIYGWGTFKASDGATGFAPDVDIARRPIRIPAPAPVTKLAAGSNHCLALTVDGTVLAWGNSEYHQLGRPINTRTRLSPLEPHPFGLKDKFTDIGTGSNHSFALHKNGAVYAWGMNNFCQTGVNSKSKKDDFFENVLRPTQVKGFNTNGKISCIAGGKEHSIACADDNRCFSWGRVDAFALGLDVDTLQNNEAVLKDTRGHPAILTTPALVPGVSAAMVAASSDHSIVVTQEGKAMSTGFSGNHQTGQGTDDDIETLTQIDNTAIREQHVVWAGCGAQYSVLAANPAQG